MSETEGDLHKETTRVLRETDMPRRRKTDSGTIAAVLRKVSTTTLIFGLLAALAGTVTIIANWYQGRIEAVEGAVKEQPAVDKKQDDQFFDYQRSQNGHLHSIDLRLEKMETEQRYMRAMVEKIDRKLDNR